MKRNGVTEYGGEEERRHLVSRRGLKETRDAMIGANSEGSMGVGREVKSGDASRWNRPAATPYLGHRLSRRGHKTVTARKASSERPTPPTESHAPVTHSPISVIGGLAPEDEGRGMGASSDPGIGRSKPNRPPTSDAAGPHPPASVIGAPR